MSLRGVNLATNLEFHYGLVNWFIGQNVMAKPTTRFVVPYLTLAGRLKEEGNKVDLAFAFAELKKHYAKEVAAAAGGDASIAKAMSEVLDRKQTLLLRPMERLLEDPHLLAGWLSLNRKQFQMQDGRVLWLRNPLGVLNETYQYLNMVYDPERPASEVIWQHDHELLQKSLRFYQALRGTFGLERKEFYKLNDILKSETPRGGYDAETWQQIRAAHLGYEAGNELLGMLFMIAEKVRFYEFKIEEDLEVTIPAHLSDPELQARMKKVLVPPPATKADEIVATCGGMYYGQEAPGKPPFVHEGMQFQKGQPLYIVEVMKMFNTIRAPFSGRVDKILMQGADGTVVQKGQPLFKITPDEKFVHRDPKEVERERRTTTTEHLQGILMTLDEKFSEVDPLEAEQVRRKRSGYLKAVPS
jgi:biotin carboxyl carrier protein